LLKIVFHDPWKLASDDEYGKLKENKKSGVSLPLVAHHGKVASGYSFCSFSTSIKADNSIY